MSATTSANGTPTILVERNGRTFETTGQHVIDFIQAYCRHTKGKWRGKPFVLLKWEMLLLYELFEIDPITRLRRYRWAYIEIPKKQGKSELVAALLLYMLIADGEESPEIACGANSDEQADLVFGAAKTMCELDDSLAALTKRFAKEIVLADNPAAKIVRCSAAVGTNDGPSYSTVALDELHEFKGERGQGLFNVLTNATGAREQPLVFMITTAGYDEETLCGAYHLHAEKIIAGEVVDPTFYAKIYAADPAVLDVLYSADAETVLREHAAAFEAAIRQANPSLGHTVQLAFYRDQFRRKPRGVFCRYFLGIWTGVEETWLKPGEWDACEVAPFEFDPALPIFLGIDASTAKDSTAVVAGQWAGTAGPNEVLRVKAHIWSAPINPQTGKPLDGWRIPIGEVEATIREYHERYRLLGAAFDPAFITWTASTLEAEGIAMIAMPQTHTRMVGPTQALYELIIDQRLAHEADPAFARHIRNARAKQVGNGGWRLVKTPDRKQNDAAIGLVMCVAEARIEREAEEDTTTSIWFPGDDQEDAA